MKKIKKSIFITLAVGVFFCYGLINTASAANYTESESNNTTGTADSISQSSVVTASLTSGDIDYYKFTPTTSGIYKIYTSSSIDTKGVLYKGASTEMISNDDGGSNFNFQICAYLSTGTTYYVKVTGYSTSTTGNYTLYVASTTTYTDLGWQYMFRSSQMATTLSDTYRTGHYAVDIVDRNSSGTNICGGYKMYSVGKGTVLEADYRASMGYFAALTLESDLVVRYLHMDSADNLKVSKGDTVTSSTHIGNVGSLGTTSTGNHLHFDINNTGGWSATWSTSNTYDPQNFFTEI